jgi:DNA invertase Pin-like site-specific DNA recombinase
MPETNALTVGITALVAEQEREAISRRTREALAAARGRGVKLGCPNGASHVRRYGNGLAVTALKAAAGARANGLAATIEAIRGEGVTSANGIAKALNERSIATPRGHMDSPWRLERDGAAVLAFPKTCCPRPVPRYGTAMTAARVGAKLAKAARIWLLEVL